MFTALPVVFAGFETRPLPDVSLEIVRGRAREKRRSVEPPVFQIGSAPDCDLVLADPRIPALHSYLLVRPEGVLLRHLGQWPTITACGQPVSSLLLSDGDRLQIGEGFEFHVGIRGAHWRRQLALHAPTSLNGVRSPKALLAACSSRDLVAEVRAAVASARGLRVFSGKPVAERRQPA